MPNLFYFLAFVDAIIMLKNCRAIWWKVGGAEGGQSVVGKELARQNF